MRLLAAESARLGKGLLYLTVHVRRSTNQHSLRWRGFVVVGGCGVRRHGVPLFVVRSTTIATPSIHAGLRTTPLANPHECWVS
jgi:hypothetical protein